MKHIKRVLAIAVALSLAFTLAMPAMAIVVDWSEFRIVTQPPEYLYVPYGESFTLSVEVNVPDGVDEVKYQWYQYRDYENDGLIAGATASTLQLSPGDPAYPAPPNREGALCDMRYYCAVTAFANGVERQLWCNSVYVTAEGSFWDKLYCLTIEPFVYAYKRNGVYLLFLPFLYPVDLINRFISNWDALLFHPERHHPTGV